MPHPAVELKDTLVYYVYLTAESLHQLAQIRDSSFIQSDAVKPLQTSWTEQMRSRCLEAKQSHLWDHLSEWKSILNVWQVEVLSCKARPPEILQIS